MKRRSLPAFIIGLALLGFSSSPVVGQTVPQEIPFQVCGRSQNWVRPTLAEHLKKIHSNPRYQGMDARAIENNILWKSRILSLNAYGLSLMVDIRNLSGLSSVSTDIYFEPCNVLKINTGETAYLILLQYRVDRVYWDKSQYVMVVKSVPQGVQVVQFPRQDRQPKMPLKVVDAKGRKLEAIVSDVIAGYR